MSGIGKFVEQDRIHQLGEVIVVDGTTATIRLEDGREITALWNSLEGDPWSTEGPREGDDGLLISRRSETYEGSTDGRQTVVFGGSIIVSSVHAGDRSLIVGLC